MAFKGKVALITGGASGMGKVMTLRIAAMGAKVAILDNNEQTLDETAALHPNIIPYKCDVTDLQHVKEIVTQVEHEIGPIDRLAHCAAIMPAGILHEWTPEQINRVMLINYCGTVNVTQTVLSYMKVRHSGDFIVFGSIAGVVPIKRFGAYCATKAATNFYMRVLMAENTDSGIRFQLVCPSAVNTPLIAQAIDGGPAFIKQAHATGKNMDTPEFIVDTIEKCLERNKQVNFPGIAYWGNIAYRLFPGVLSGIINRLS
ncbi:MAG: SDR family NAD(P)-dependent oxidoreductase [Flavipsychrobacter sp.]|nr:SDR family NAD(P)-dependent oxidoreductase [Flavipsychrobacter sp.]